MHHFSGAVKCYFALFLFGALSYIIPEIKPMMDEKGQYTQQFVRGALPPALLQQVQDRCQDMKRNGQCVTIDRDALESQRDALRQASRIQGTHGGGMVRKFECEKE